MPIIIDEFDQRSLQWTIARLGSPGASSISQIITSTGKVSGSRQRYMNLLAEEILTGRSEDSVQTEAMLRGVRLEAEARNLFSFLTDLEVRQVALVYYDNRKLWHVSPDGLIGNDAGLEIKCPGERNHMEYLKKGVCPSNFFGQVQMSLFTTERKCWHFMSYHPEFDPLIVQVERDEEYIKQLEAALEEFCSDLKQLLKEARSED